MRYNAVRRFDYCRNHVRRNSPESFRCLMRKAAVDSQSRKTGIFSEPVKRQPSTISLVSGSPDEFAAAFEANGLVAKPIPVNIAESQPSQRNEFANFVGELITGGIDSVLLMTSWGTGSLIEIATATTDRERFLNGLQDSQLLSGSAATTRTLGESSLTPALKADALHGWRKTLLWLESNIELSNRRIAIESTLQDSGLFAGLESRGVRVRPIKPHATLPTIESDLLSACSNDEPLVMFVTSAMAANALCNTLVASRLTNLTLDRQIVIARGDETADVLIQNGIKVEFVTDLKPVAASGQLAARHEILVTRNQKLIMNMSGPNAPSNDTNAPWYDSPFMKACRGEPSDVTPVWMMRQAGRYMQEYREVRAKVSFLDLCANPQLCSEVMCTAVSRLGVDAAIIFSDLLPMLVPMGCDLEFVKGDGPVIHNPVRSAADVDRIKPLESNDELQFVMETVKQTRADLPADMPLIGFSGAPFTLASYMIEGGSSRNYAHAKALMFGDRGAWNELMQRLSDSIVIYLKGQIDAGAQCVQLFDSWAGCLNVQHYREFVLPFVQQIIGSLPEEVPVINFGTGNPALLPLYADTAASVVGIDWRVRLDEAWETVGHDRAVQGNLDPTILLTDPATIRKHVKDVLDQAAGRPGHIFNLGHGILPQTPVDNAIALVDAVHELS